MRKKLIIGNWKMNPTSAKEAEKLWGDISKTLPSLKKTEAVISAPFLYLSGLKKISKKISLGAQNSYSADKGPFTGEVSPAMLENLGVKYVILGHSERRAMGETDSDINKKIRASISAGLFPVLCVGEKERNADHAYFAIVESQLKKCLEGINKNILPKITIAYEPVWAISSTPLRHDAIPADFLEMSIFIRKILSDLSNPKVASEVRIIYGGSVDDRDAEGFLREGGADGLLAGRASLNPKKFVKIIEIAERT